MTKEKQSSPGSPKKKITPRRYSSRDKRIEELRQYVRTDGRKYLEDENITSIGIGYKIKDGERTKKLCIQFTVKTKPEEGVGLEGLETEMIPESIEVAGKGIPTDVIQREYKLSFRRANTEQLNARKRRSDPLVAGISVSHPTGTAGTLGVFVVDNVSGTLCMLSNWHVLHRHEGKIGDIIVQPGPFDDNDVGNNRVGKLLRSHLGEAGDCAIATVENRDMSRQILDLQTHPEEVVRVDLDDRVIKSGRTTEVTLGVVRRIDVISQINYEGVGPVNIGCFEIGP
ncbi:MAG: hypothetical protein OEQ53_12995, partial [Saprospiraceae bacterium]|nr:hypothetical protein [Saprospiraceae bacterium]